MNTPHIPQAEIIAVGSELLHGGRVDSNSVFVADCLAQCGLEVRNKITVGDRSRDIQAALRTSVKRASVIIVMGGLGSTIDDCTREAVAKTFKRRLICRRTAYEVLKVRFNRLGRDMTPLLTKQALIPVGAKILSNAVGTAPGFYLRQGSSMIVVIPGVPREAKVMMEKEVKPVLLKRIKQRQVYWTHVFNTYGLPETDLQTELASVLYRSPEVQFGLLPSPKGVVISVKRWVANQSTISAIQRSTIQSEWNSLIESVRHELQPWVFSEGLQTLEEKVGDLLTHRSWKMAIAESCTGGLIAHRMTEVSGSSGYFERGVVSYSNQAKKELLGVSSDILRRFGAVSCQVAEAMAKGIRVRSQVDLGVSVTGIAGPGGGSLSKPVGLVYLAIDGPHGCQSKRCQFRGNRTEIKLRSSQAALDLIRRYVLQMHT